MTKRCGVICGVLFSIFLFVPSIVHAENLVEFIAPVAGQRHELSTGECVYFTAEGKCPTGMSPVRQWKNENWEQFCIAGDGIYRQEDTSGAFGVCSDGNDANYTLDGIPPGQCNQFSDMQSVSGEGAWWAPISGSTGTTWQMPPHQILPISVDRATGEKKYCSGVFAQPWCNVQWAPSRLDILPPGSFTFQEMGTTNKNPIARITGGTGEEFYYMQGYGLVAFIGGGFDVEMINDKTCTFTGAKGINLERLKKPCNYYNRPKPDYHPLRPYPFNPCDPLIQERGPMAFQCSNGIQPQGTFDFPNIPAQDALSRPLLDIDNLPQVEATLPYKDNNIRYDERLYRCDDAMKNTDQPNICAVQRVPFDLEIDLSTAKLPVIGFTERPLSNTVKTNNYLSWYLQGADWDKAPPRLGAIANPPPPGQVQDPSVINKIEQDAAKFLDAGAEAYLPWQYSGEKANPIENDSFSFFTGSETCTALKELAVKYPGKIGVNIFNFKERYKPSVVDGRSVGAVDLDYLKGSCGTSIVRMFGDTNPDGVIAALKTLQGKGMKAILALHNFAIGGQLSFYNNYATYKGYAINLTTRIKNEGLTDTIYTLELSNEPHCGNNANCVDPYVAWANDMISSLKATGFTGRIGIGQSTAIGRGESPTASNPPHPVDFVYSNQQADITSGHYYDAAGMELNLRALSLSKGMGKPFYVGEAGGFGASTGNVGSLGNVDPFLTFSGPIRKLLSQQNLDMIRVLVKDRTFNDLHDYLLRPYSANKYIRQAPNYSQNMAAALREVFTKIPLSNMEDMVGEVVVSILPEAQAQPTYQDSRVILEPNPNKRNAIELHISRGDNDSLQPYSDGRLYMPHLRETYGLTYILQNYALPRNNYTNAQGQKAFYFPGQHALNPSTDASEEVKTKIIGAPDKNAHQGLEDNTVIQLTFESPEYGEVPTRNTEIIDNPIPRGSNNQILQSKADVSGYMRNSLDNPSDTLEGRAPAPHLVLDGTRFYTQSDPRYTGFDAICQIGNTMLTPGDSLVSGKDKWKIRARLTYTNVFKYPSLPPPNCIDAQCDNTKGGACKGGRKNPAESGCGQGYRCSAATDPTNCPGCAINDSACIAVCLQDQSKNGTCIPADSVSRDTGARVSVYTKTPLVEDIYNRLVAGQQSVLRRFLPQRTEELASTNNCNDEYLKGETWRVQDQLDKTCVKNVSTRVAYTAKEAADGAASPYNRSDPDSIKPGANVLGQPTANLYFPYLGSLYDYFLGAGREMLNLQRLLRPKGFMGSSFQTDTTQAPVGTAQLQCTIPMQSCAPIDWNSPQMQQFVTTYSKRYNDPALYNGVNWSLLSEPFAQNLINSSGLCPGFLLTLCTEETHCGAIGGAYMGCKYFRDTGQATTPIHIGKPDSPGKIARYTQSLQEQIDCVRSYVNQFGTDFNTFMCTYAGETDTNPSQPGSQCTQFVNNANFPVNVCKIGSQLGVATSNP